MSLSRRGFLGRLGVGILGVGGVLVPSAVLACHRRCAPVVCEPWPGAWGGPTGFGPGGQPLQFRYVPYRLADVTLSYPSPVGAQVPLTGGTFYSWGYGSNGSTITACEVRNPTGVGALAGATTAQDPAVAVPGFAFRHTGLLDGQGFALAYTYIKNGMQFTVVFGPFTAIAV
jgi:hypothetical protein